MEEYQYVFCHYKFNKEILQNQFLNKQEVIELSKLFNIISHGMYHRDLRYHKNIQSD